VMATTTIKLDSCSATDSSWAMTEQPRTLDRGRLHEVAGQVDAATEAAVDAWLRDFLALP
jgi:mRNA interferase MazF